MTGPLDPLLHAYRPDLADRRLQGRVRADRYVEGTDWQCRVGTLPIRGAPDDAAPMTTELLFGERFRVFDQAGDWVWGQCGHDGYVGYAPASGLAPELLAATHRVRALAAFVYPQPMMKHTPLDVLSLGAAVTVTAVDRSWAALATGGYAHAPALAALGSYRPATDPAGQAERFLEVPYLWGGRSARGLDCSGLVQVCLAECGHAVPRDTGMQEPVIGQPLPADRWDGCLRRGDIVFFPGHVGFMVDPTRLIHANATAMAVTVDPLDRVVAIVRAGGGTGITSVRRLAG